MAPRFRDPWGIHTALHSKLIEEMINMLFKCLLSHILDILLPSDFSKQNSDMIINCRINLFLKAQADGIEILEEFRLDFQLVCIMDPIDLNSSG